MYLPIRIIMVSLCVCSYKHVFAQSERINNNSIEMGLYVAGDETLFYGANGKFIMPLSQKKHYPTPGLSLTIHLDRKGESESRAYLKKL